MAEGRVQRRRRDQKPLPQRILDLMKDGNPNEAHQGIVIAEFFRNLYQFPSQTLYITRLKLQKVSGES